MGVWWWKEEKAKASEEVSAKGESKMNERTVLTLSKLKARYTSHFQNIKKILNRGGVESLRGHFARLLIGGRSERVKRLHILHTICVFRNDQCRIYARFYHAFISATSFQQNIFRKSFFTISTNAYSICLHP